VNLPRRTLRLAVVPWLAFLHYGGYVVVDAWARSCSPDALWHTSIALDAQIPYLPWTWVFYWAAHPFVFVGGSLVLMWLPEKGFRRAVVALAATALLGDAIQIAIPARMPWPHPQHPAQALIHWSSREGDFATLPSMHVAFSTLIASLAFMAFPSRLVRALFAAMAAAIALSTLTLREHVVLDVVSGVGLGMLTALWFAHDPEVAIEPRAPQA
jgi:membrane-associated phospholipid phosphatase